VNLHELYYKNCSKLRSVIIYRKYSEVEPLYQRAIAIFSEKLGENHPNTQTVTMNYHLMLSQLPDEELNQRFPPEAVEMLRNLRQAL
jgi:hypothetical protein